MSYIGDPRLKPRIRQLLDEDQKKYFSSNSVADALQSKYSDYGRKKKLVFRKQVQKACQGLLPTEKQSQQDQLQSSSDEFSGENQIYVEYKDTNSVNSMVSDMYRKSQKRTASSAPVSACSSPRQPDTGTQTPDLHHTLFHIDRMGSKKSEDNNRQGMPNNSVALKPVSDEETAAANQNGEVKTPLGKRSKDEDDFNTKSVSSTKKKRKLEKGAKKKGAEIQQSSVTFADVGGIENTIKEVCKLLSHMTHPEVFTHLGVNPPRGFLLHGPPGCGKTLLADAIAGELGLPYIKLAATEVVSGVSGDSEEKLRDIFDRAVENAPCVLFIDQIDSITQKRENASKDMERRIVAQLLTCMDDLNSKRDVQVLVIGATNRPDSLDPSLRRAGRFDREISLGIPSETARQRILEVLCRGLTLPDTFDFLSLARQTPGFVGADLMALKTEAAMVTINRIFREMQEAKRMGTPASNDKPESGRVNANMNDATNTLLTPSTGLLQNNALRDTLQELTAISDRGASGQCVQAMDTEDLSIGAGGDIKHAEEYKDIDNESATSVHSITTKSSLAFDAETRFLLSWIKDKSRLSAEELAALFITMGDFESALKHVQPSAKREGFATVPDVTWNDIGALHDLREELQMAILAPVRYPEQFDALGLTSPPGILLAGPPGCGKTLLAKAVANESGINFISVKGPELLNKYVGESERGVRQVFQRARNSAPCVIFFDELDALCPRRSGGESGSSVRVVNQMLTEMDGLEERKQVFIMAATNRPDIIDPAILRPGRLDKQLYVGLPGPQDRWDILTTITKDKPKLSSEVDLKEIANEPKCAGFTGADLTALVTEAKMIALKENMKRGSTEAISVNRQHFQLAFNKVKPSVSEQDLKVYARMKSSLNVS